MTISGIEVFPEITWVGIGILAVVFFASYFVKGAIGMGALSPAILFSTLIVGPHHAVLLAVFTNSLSHLQFLLQGLRDGDWRIARKVIVGNFTGSVLGIWIFGQLNNEWLTLLLGITLGGVWLTDITNALERLSRRINLRSPFIIYPLSGAAGVISGVTGAGGLFFVAIYIKHVCPDPKSFRGTVILLSMLVVVWRAIILIGVGFIDSRVIMEGATLLPAIILGGVVGTWFYRRLPVAGFYRLFQAAILFGAVGLIWKGLRDIL